MADNLTLNPLSSYLNAAAAGYTQAGQHPATRAGTADLKVLGNAAPNGVAVSISAAGQAMAKMSRASEKQSGQDTGGSKAGAKDPFKTGTAGTTAGPANPLSDSDQASVQKLKETDAMVHQHEQAHMAAGGNLVRGGPHYEYKKGPDGKSYAVAGDVSIDMSKVPNDPAATIRKAEQIKRAALAPANPSAQDQSVASEAGAMESEARVEEQKTAAGAGADSSTGARKSSGSAGRPSSPYRTSPGGLSSNGASTRSAAA